MANPPRARYTSGDDATHRPRHRRIGVPPVSAPPAQARLATVASDDDGIRLDRWFQRHVPELGFGAVARLARTGQIRIDGRRTTPAERIATGAQIRVPPPPVGAASAADAPRPLPPEEVAFAQAMVIHRDAAALVLDKPPGLATQGGTGTLRHVDGMLPALSFDSPQKPKLVHRLDKDTSGVLLVARTGRAAGFFAKAFAGRTARKVYWAIVIGTPRLKEGMIEAPLAKQPGSGGEKMHVDPAGLPARTRYRVIDRAADRAAWIEFQPLTGRTHQIRVHAAAMGHPVVGDAKYGGADAFLTGAVSRKLHLHARRLVIDHPDGGLLDVSAPAAEHFARTLETLGFDPKAGDALPLDPLDPRDTPEGRARFEAAQARTRRRARKGERRARGARD